MTVRQHEWLICVDSEWQYSHLSFSNWSSPGTFSYTNAASLIKEFTPFVNKYFSCYFLSKHHTKSPSHCNHGPRLTKTRQAFSIFCFEHSLNNCEWALRAERLWNSSGTTYRLDVTYSNAFTFHSSSCAFMNNTTVKLYMFLMYTLYMKKGVLKHFVLVAGYN
jgi:hypothetical protein